VHCAHEIHFHGVAEIGGRHFVEGHDAADACVIDENIAAAEGIPCRLDDRRATFRGCD
jgi:hypothetical protein